MNEAFEPLDRLLESIRLRSEKFQAVMDAAPQEKPCQTHAGETTRLDHEASMKAGSLVYQCPKCQRARELAMLDRRLDAANIPADVRHATLDNYMVDRPDIQLGHGCVHPTKFREAARRVAAGEIRNAIFAGSPGIGKGHLAAAVAIAFIMQNKRVKWTEISTLFREWHDAYSTSSTDRVLREHANPYLLVLDEVAFRAVKDEHSQRVKSMPADGEEILFAIMNARHKAGLPTIMLGNKSADDTRQWLGDRICDRLRSGGVAFCFGQWASMRGTAHDGANNTDEF